MLSLDEFESVFRAAAKERYEYEPVRVDHALLVTALHRAESEKTLDGVKNHLRAVFDEQLSWDVAPWEAYHSVDELLKLVSDSACSLICTHRNLSGKAGSHPYSLGSYVDVLTQATELPVMLVPTPADDGELPNRARDTRRVMVLTDEVTADSRLIHYAARFTVPGGDLFLAHLEDEHTFARYMDVVSKLPGIDTEEARESIAGRLLKEPSEYIESCRSAFAEAGLDLHVHGIVKMGHPVKECRRLVEENDIDMVVMNTKDDEQLAMHGLAYTLSIELRDISLLLL